MQRKMHHMALRRPQHHETIARTRHSNQTAAKKPMYTQSRAVAQTWDDVVDVLSHVSSVGGSEICLASCLLLRKVAVSQTWHQCAAPAAKHVQAQTAGDGTAVAHMANMSCMMFMLRLQALALLQPAAQP